MRASPGLLFCALLLIAGTTQAQPAPDLRRAPTRFVCLDNDRHAFAGESPSSAGTSDTWAALVDQAGDRGLAHCWSWSQDCAPRRLAPGENHACADRPEQDDRLQVRVTLAPGDDAVSGSGRDRLAVAPRDPGDDDSARPDHADLVHVVAAPVPMWQEVPFSLLPRTPADGLSLALPRTPEPWRVQAQAAARSSALLDVPAEQTSVEIPLLPAADVSVRVTAEGLALTDARVFFVRPQEGVGTPAKSLGFAAPDNEGTVRFTAPEGDRSAVVVSSATRTASVFARWTDLPATVELGAGLAVSGQVVNTEGEPVPAVRLLGRSWIPDGFGLQQRHAGLSGDDGRFELTGFAAGPATLTTEDGEREFARALELETSVDLGRIVLARPERAWVRIESAESGSFVPDARIRNESGEWSTVDQEGLAHVRLVFNRRILVSAEGYLLKEVHLPAGAGVTADEALTISLQPSFSIRGAFVAADGQTPAAGGHLSAYSEANNTYQYEALALDGSFVLELLPGDYTLNLWAANAGLRRLEIGGRGGETADIGTVTAPVSAWVSGYVAAPDYAPIAEAAVSWIRPSEIGPLMAWALGEAVSTTTDLEGYFEIHGLLPGQSTLRVTADGFVPLDFQVEAAGTEWVDAGHLELSRGRRVRVRSDVVNGTVEIEPGAERHPRDRVTGRLHHGELTVAGVPDDALRVRVLERGVVVCEKETAARGDTAVTCNRNSVTVTGRVTIGGRPGGGMLLWRQDRGNEGGLPEGIITTGTGPMQRTDVVSESAQELQATLDDEGSYRLEAVLPGDWQVIWATVEGAARESRSVHVPDHARRTTIDFQYRGVSLDGVVLDAEGLPVPNATVDVFPGSAWAMSGHDGRFQVLGLDPGAYELQAREGRMRSRLVRVSLRNHDDRETVELRLEDDPPSSELAINVRNGSGGFCFVETGDSHRQVTEIRAGVATVDLPSPLSERLRVACRSDGRWVLGDWRDLRQALERGIEFDLDDANASMALVGETSTSAIRIVGPGGWDLGSLRLWFGAAATFSTGETIENLPVGQYTLTWSNQVRTATTERRRTTEIEID